jgi:transposase
MVHFERLPGKFTQHDFGHVKIAFMNGCKTIHFFVSRLKYSRWAAVSDVSDEVVETLVRRIVEHFALIGGVPLVAVFDRPKTVALSWRKNGEVNQWNPIFAAVMLELGVGVELYWPSNPQQKGSVENLVGWVKGSFFKQRRFWDEQDLRQQLTEWLAEVNENHPS